MRAQLRTGLSRRRLLVSGGTTAVLAGSGILGACRPLAAPGGRVTTEPVELSLMVRDIAAEVKSWENVFNVFIEQSGGKYRGNFMTAPAGEVEYTEKVATLIAAGTPPDVFFLLARAKAAFVEQGLVLDLTSRIKASKTARPDLYFKPMQEAMQYKGRYWGTAEDYNTTVLLLNLTLFQEQGLARPRLDWTYEEYRTLARRLANPDKRIFGGDNWMQGAGIQNLATLWSFGRHFWVSSDETKALVNSPASIEAHEFFRQMALVERTVPSPTNPAAQGQGGDEGYFAVWASWANKPWQLHVKHDGKVPYQWTLQTFPKGPADQKQGSQGHLYAIPAGVKRPDDAWVLAEWIGGIEGWRQFVKIGRGIPLPVADRALWEEYYGFLPKEKAAELIDLVVGRFYPQYALDITYPPYFEQLRQVMAEALRAIYSGQAAVKSALDGAAERMEAILADYRRQQRR
jgi:multiple sugar transport system substrate-binding protein